MQGFTSSIYPDQRNTTYSTSSIIRTSIIRASIIRASIIRTPKVFIKNFFFLTFSWETNLYIRCLLQLLPKQQLYPTEAQK